MPLYEINAVPINHLRVLQTNNKEKPSYRHTVQFIYFQNSLNNIILQIWRLASKQNQEKIIKGIVNLFAFLFVSERFFPNWR